MYRPTVHIGDGSPHIVHHSCISRDDDVSVFVRLVVYNIEPGAFLSLLISPVGAIGIRRRAVVGPLVTVVVIGAVNRIVFCVFIYIEGAAGVNDAQAVQADAGGPVEASAIG